MSSPHADRLRKFPGTSDRARASHPENRGHYRVVERGEDKFVSIPASPAAIPMAIGTQSATRSHCQGERNRVCEAGS